MPAKKKKKSSSQTLIVLVLLAILAVVIISVKNISNWATQFNPPPPDYQNILPGWNTYVNKTYRFYLKYPDKWYVRTFGDYAANFQTTDPKLGEATQGAIRVKFSALTEKADESEFLQIVKTDPSTPIHEPLDVISIITKVKNFTIAKSSGVEYVVNRRFTAPEGPRGQFTHVYSIFKNGAVLKFFADDNTKEEEAKFDTIFQKMITTLRL